jgi:release factor glutamine methyltransferase
MLAPPGVFHPRSDTWLLHDTVVAETSPGDRFLELCAGPAAVAIGAARAGADATAVELSPWSALAARANARLAGVQLAVRCGDLYRPGAGQTFDVIAANPPYLPSADPSHAARGADRAWAAGPTGREILDRLIAGLPRHLRPGGRVLLVHSSITGEGETVTALREVGLVKVSVTERRTGPLGPLVTAQQRLGVIDPALDEEDVIVVRGVAPD